MWIGLISVMPLAMLNRELGAYRTFATDFERTVVLILSNCKIVLSPDNPEAFVNSVLQRRSDG